MSSPSRIVLVDDHPMVREGLAEIINRESDLLVCGEAEDRGEALEMIMREQPKLAIVDLSLRRSSGLDLIKDLKNAAPGVLILVLSMQDEDLYAERVIRAGAHGYITKQEATRKVLEAIRQVLEGKIFMSARISDQILARMLGRTPVTMDPVKELTDRELQVFSMVGEGYSARQIAEHLGLDAKTVETYRSRIKEKLELKDSSELLRRAIAWRSDQGLK